jgi:hypothetical protein
MKKLTNLRMPEQSAMEKKPNDGVYLKNRKETELITQKSEVYQIYF